MNSNSNAADINVQGKTAQVFQFKQQLDVRAVTIDGDPWFYAMDVCAAVGLTDTNKALLGLDDDEKCEHEQYSGSGRKPLLINESGLYSLILRSRKPEAKAFKKWVTAEVLPAIRKHGMYLHAPAMRPSMTNEHWQEIYRKIDSMCSGWALGKDSKNWVFNHKHRQTLLQVIIRARSEQKLHGLFLALSEPVRVDRPHCYHNAQY